MRKISATRIYPISGKPLQQGYIVLDNDGTIIDIVEQPEGLQEISGLEYYSGILIPGLILTQSTNSAQQFVYSGQKLIGAERILWKMGVQALAFSESGIINYPVSRMSLLSQLRKEITKDLQTGLEHLTLQTAKQCKLEHSLGSFEKNKRPGVLLITGFDMKKQRCTANLSVQRLV